MVAALQETKWFGDNVYAVGKSIVLTAGRPVPGNDDARQRGEGVALVLSGPAISGWKAGGSRWKAWSSRLLSISIKIGDSPHDILHILSCYAPTFAATRVEKDKFYDDLQCALSEIPSREMYVVMGDFNARVGSRTGMDDQWQDVRGPHGFGNVNEAGTSLLSFLSINEAVICNTWFEKRDIHKATWQHPGSKQWHCIDFMIMRKSQHLSCLDVSVMRGAECNTDHLMLRMKLLVKPIRFFNRRLKFSKARFFDVSKLRGPEFDDAGELTARGQYQKEVSQKLKDLWKTWISTFEDN